MSIPPLETASLIDLSQAHHKHQRWRAEGETGCSPRGFFVIATFPSSVLEGDVPHGHEGAIRFAHFVPTLINPPRCLAPIAFSLAFQSYTSQTPDQLSKLFNVAQNFKAIHISILSSRYTESTGV